MAFALGVALLAGLTLALPRAAFASGPTISGFAPTSGPLRTIVTISGSGLLFTTTVTVGGVSASFRIVNGGTLQARVPDSAPSGPIVVTAMGGIVTSATNFTVTPGLLLNSSPPRPLAILQQPPLPPITIAQAGDTVKAQGSGFTPGETVAFALDGVSLGVTTIADGAGAFANVAAPIPANTTSALHQVSATGQTSAATISAPLKIAVFWAQFGFDSGHTGYNPRETSVSPANVATLVPGWTTNIPKGYAVYSQQAVGDGNVYITSQACYMNAFALDTGALIWSYNVCLISNNGAIGYSTPTLAQGTVYVAGDGYLWAWNDQTGALLWKTALPISGGFGMGSYVTYADGMVFTLDDAGVAHALDAMTGAPLWNSSSHPGTCANSTAIAGGAVYLYINGTVIALNESTGAQLWSTALPSQSCAVGTTVANGQVYVINTNTVQQLDTLYALNASTGATTWSVTVPSFGAGAPAPTVANGIVYLKTYQSASKAYNALTGALLWSSPLGVANWTIPVVANGVLYVASGQDVITANATTGARLWSAVVGGDGAHITYATVADGVVYVIVSQPNNASTIKTFHLPTAAPNGPTPSGPHRSRTL